METGEDTGKGTKRGFQGQCYTVSTYENLLKKEGLPYITLEDCKTL